MPTYIEDLITALDEVMTARARRKAACDEFPAAYQRIRDDEREATDRFESALQGFVDDRIEEVARRERQRGEKD